MKYMGSKNRHALDIINTINNYCLYDTWVEPFVGGANIIDKVQCTYRYGNDINIYLISMFQSLQNGWIPPDFITENEYNVLKNKSLCFDNLNNNALIGFVGIGCSYSGKWFGGYARGKNNKGIERNYCKESKNNVLKQIKNLLNVKFTCNSYLNLNLPSCENSIIYCDPPYENVTKYKDNFNHKLFWEWCNYLCNKKYKVFVSEYNAPIDWRCVWEKQVNSSLTKNTGSKQGTECLFTKL